MLISLNAHIICTHAGSSPVTFSDLAPGDHTVGIRPNRVIARAPPLSCGSVQDRVVMFSID